MSTHADLADALRVRRGRAFAGEMDTCDVRSSPGGQRDGDDDEECEGTDEEEDSRDAERAPHCVRSFDDVCLFVKRVMSCSWRCSFLGLDFLADQRHCWITWLSADDDEADGDGGGKKKVVRSEEEQVEAVYEPLRL